MNTIARPIDHLVYVVPDLQKGMTELEHRLGCPVIYGGQHLNQGTHNALVNLGNNCYLELLAIDQTNSKISAPRWMGVDIVQEPQLTRWALKSKQLEQDVQILQKANAAMQNIVQGSRQRTDGSILNWEILMPLPQPAVELLPFMVDWQDSIHPTESLDTHCQLVELKATHPNPLTLQTILQQLQAPLTVTLGTTIRLQAIIDCPRGRIIL